MFAVDVGGTDIKSATVDESGALRDVRRTPTPLVPGDGDATARAVADTVARLVPPDAAAIGLIVPGWVDDERGIAVHSENLGWRNFDFPRLLEARLGIPIGFGHDVRAAGLAEYELGAARDYSSAAVVPIGTGIAAALILDGRLYSGRGLAGEIGHMRVADGPRCACGARGCLEAIASAAAIARAYTRRTGNDVGGARDVLARMHAGDRAAAEVWQSALDALATAFTALTTLLAPEAIVIGGGLAAAGDDLFAPLHDSIAASLTFQQAPALVPARFGPDAGLIGAGLLGARLAGTGARS